MPALGLRLSKNSITKVKQLITQSENFIPALNAIWEPPAELLSDKKKHVYTQIHRALLTHVLRDTLYCTAFRHSVH